MSFTEFLSVTRVCQHKTIAVLPHLQQLLQRDEMNLLGNGHRKQVNVQSEDEPQGVFLQKKNVAALATTFSYQEGLRVT